MAKLTEEQLCRRRLARARREALAAEEDERRMAERRAMWEREGMYQTREEFESGEPCRGCGEPLLDGHGARIGLVHMTPEQRAEHDAEEARFKERHGDCHAFRWTMEGSRTMHCGYCCPPHPMSARQWKAISRILDSGPKDPDRWKELDAWDLALTCNHVVQKTAHRSNDRYSASVIDCPECGQKRGIVEQTRVGPADDPEGRIREERLAQELAAAEAKLVRQRQATAATEARIADLRRQADAPRHAGE
ncbi:hypothetical protein ACPA54_12850 [Uniformispora flossi]|uniref:hypothetical protein n=1 Tax=Uniformispora flossi TaxID=3390723 RepID=UPI003C2EB85C